MNKMKKLLSVLLAVVIALSCMSVMASAATTAYKTVSDLQAVTDGGTVTAYSAYSPYGQVTRLSTEARASMIQDFLDSVLPGLNINMGTVLDVLGLTITINLTSVDNLCISFDSFKDTFDNTLYSIAAAIVNLGVLEELNFDTWNTGIDRAGDAQLTLFAELFQLLSNNTTVVETVLTDGLDLGIVAGMIGNIDLDPINEFITDLPSLVKGLIFGLFERWDDTAEEIEMLETNASGDGKIEETLTWFVKNLFTNDMSITTVKADSTGTTTSEHSLPGENADARVRYIQNGTVLTAKTYATQEYVDAQLKANPDSTLAKGDYYVSAIYVLEPEVGTEDYVWAQVEVDAETGEIVYEEDENGDPTTTPKKIGANLKYYNLNSPLLPSLDATIDLSTMSAADLLYTFISPVFGDMAPVVLNGSLKKILGGFFGAKYNYIGEVGSDEVNALADATDAFFTEEQGDYLWEWSNYAVINGNHYYRFEDQIFAADLSNVNNYFHIINWDYEITTDFMDEFIPENGGSTSDTLFMNLNDFLIKVANEVLVASATTTNAADGATAAWTRPTFTAGANSNLVGNIKALAQAIISLAPQHIFGSDYQTNPRCYYDMFMSSENDIILTGIAAQLVDILMPSMTLPTADELIAADAKVGAVLAAVIREFAAQLVPEYNYDALIYADFGTTSSDKVKTFIDPVANGLVTSGQTASSYWLDVIMRMAIDIGYEYLRAFADIGEDSEEVLAGVVNQGYMHDGGTYAAGTTQATLQAQWEAMLDYIIDWALSKGTATKTETVQTGTKGSCDSTPVYEEVTTTYQKNMWTWRMENLVDTTGLTIDLATAQDPWVKLGKIFNDLLPIEEILNIDVSNSLWLETTLRDNFILSLVDLKWENITNLLIVPDGALRTDNVLDQLATVLKNLVNGLFKKIGGGSYEFIPSSITDFDTLASQAGIRDLAVGLVGKLETAYNNGLLDTVFPLLNFFIGWKTDPQVMADPVITYSFRDGNDYAFQWSGQTNYPAIDADSTVIKFLNNSSGMLETHRNSSVVDNEYAITIKSVTSDATVNSLTFTVPDDTASPYETIEIKIGGTYNGEEAATITIAYDFVGKDGKAVGGTQYISRTIFFSNQYEDANVDGREDGDDSDGYASIAQFKKFQFTEDLYNVVTTFEPSISGTNATLAGTSNFKSVTAPDNSVDMNALASTYFAYYQNQDGGWGDSFPKDGSTSGKLYYAKDGVTEDTEFPYGRYDMGRVAVKYGDDSKVWEIDYIHYNDYDVYDIYTANKDRGITANDVTDVAVYNEWNAAFKDIVKLATYPMMTEGNGNSATDYVSVIMPQIEPAIERFEAADEALSESMADANASAGADSSLPSHVQTLLTQLETDDKAKNGFEINYQDYEYYEYFNYADLRTAARNLYASYLAPDVMDTHYILNSGIRLAELNNVISAESNATVAAAIEATKLENDPAAVAASQEAYDNWQMPTHTKLYVDDMTSRLAYYKQFVEIADHKEDADHLYFLNQEIAHVEAQGFVESDYTAASWERYAEALATAKAVAAGTDEYASYNSRIFDVKWELMVARKNLLAKADSLIEAGGTAELLANIDLAEAILAKSLDEITLSNVAIEKGLTKEQALGHLLQGLGYYYTGEDGNEWNLYADSAYEYRDNDRPNRSSNQAKVNACNNNLVACLAYFSDDVEVEFVGINGGVITDTTEEGAEKATGYVSGIEVGTEDVKEFFTTNNTGSIEVALGTASALNGTGALITVKDLNDNVVGEYILVVYGDVNGDGSIDLSDYNALDQYTQNTTSAINGDPNLIAADADKNGEIALGDYNALDQYTQNTTSAITQTA